MLSGAAAVRITASYAVALVAVSLTLTALGPHARGIVVSDMSTNLHNLRHGHLGTLVGSAFVNDSDEVYIWLPGLVCLLALGELIWRSRGLLITFAVGHIGATLLVAAGLVTAVESGWLPFSVARASDVGISYGAVCVLGALTASIPLRWRPAWLGWWLGIASAATLGADFTAVGHVLALLLGIGLSFRLRSIARWTPIHVGLLVAGAAFGYLVLSGPSVVATVGGLAGMLSALIASRVRRSRTDTGPMFSPQPEFAPHALSYSQSGR
ncbi:rhomboid-like protein [Mycobacterium sp.]|uniref:rhomboid-like protein n=1 Tax=Mycobacterium sp. TaxID=1785 RepID=UPI003C71DC4E